jgi:hypothetical protein
MHRWTKGATVRSKEIRDYGRWAAGLPPTAQLHGLKAPTGRMAGPPRDWSDCDRMGARSLALGGICDEGGEYQADVPTPGVIAGHIWCDVRHLQVSGIDVVQDYGTVQCFALLPAQLL